MNPHQVLGISPDASEDEIKKAYRKLAREHHPDVGGDAEKFKEVQKAYEILTGKTSQPQSSFNPFDDIFSQFFGGGRRVERGRDIQTECEITFMEAAHGCERTVQIRTGEACQSCQGKGFKEFTTCPTCHGQGNVRYKQGNILVSSTCGQCRGQGKTSSSPCTDCDSQGISKETKDINVKIPEGIFDGANIRLAGYGEKKEHPGDGYVKINVKPHPLFHREDDNLTFILPITFGQAVFGDKVKVPLLSGSQEITIPKGIRLGECVVLEGKGFFNPQTRRRGDCIVRLEIDTSIPKDEKTLKEFMEKEGVSELRKNYLEIVDRMNGAI